MALRGTRRSTWIAAAVATAAAAACATGPRFPDAASSDAGVDDLADDVLADESSATDGPSADWNDTTEAAPTADGDSDIGIDGGTDALGDRPPTFDVPIPCPDAPFFYCEWTANNVASSRCGIGQDWWHTAATPGVARSSVKHGISGDPIQDALPGSRQSLHAEFEDVVLATGATGIMVPRRPLPTRNEASLAAVVTLPDGAVMCPACDGWMWPLRGSWRVLHGAFAEGDLLDIEFRDVDFPEYSGVHLYLSYCRFRGILRGPIRYP